jgi:CMP-N,N'-diacetyllegionaminic acid synthase
MIKKKKILAVVPARGGSKGVKLKNLYPIGGVPLVALAGNCLEQVLEIDRRVVSTDHEEIARIAEASGLAAPFRRPPALSGDRIGDWDVLNHALLEMEKIDEVRYDIILMIQPTSPLRTAKNVSDVLKFFVDGNWDAVWSVSETDLSYHPMKQLIISDDKLAFYDPEGVKIIARQQLQPIYHRNGIAYVFSRECILEQKSKLGARTGAFIIEGPAISIDTVEDFAAVERLMNKLPV